MLSTFQSQHLFTRLVPCTRLCGIKVHTTVPSEKHNQSLSKEGGGCLLSTIGTAVSEAALSEFHSKLQTPSLPLGAAQNDRPTLPSSLLPSHISCLPQKLKPVVVYEVLVREVKPASVNEPAVASM